MAHLHPICESRVLKNRSSTKKLLTGVISAWALIILMAPGNHAKLIIADDFPIAGVEASQLPVDSRFDLLLADYEEDTVLLEFGDYLDIEEIFFQY